MQNRETLRKDLMQGLILAAGRGKRLRPISNFMPKPLLKIGGKTLIEHQINLLEKLAIRKIIVVIGHLANLIENFLEKLPARMEIITVRQEELTGEIGAIDCAREFINEQFLVLHGDNYLVNLDYFITSKKIGAEEAKVLVSVDRNKIKDNLLYLTDSGVLSLDYVSNENSIPVVPLGCYLLNPSVFDVIDELRDLDFQTCTNYHLFKKLLEEGYLVYAIKNKGVVANINTIWDLLSLKCGLIRLRR